MNSFNRLLYTYRFIFNRKILFDYNRKMLKILYFQKNAYICNTEKTIKKNFREKKTLGKKKPKPQKFPTLFTGTALEEKDESWNVIRASGNNQQKETNQKKWKKQIKKLNYSIYLKSN